MNIGLVLSGGMAKGAYQIGVLRALSEYIPLEEVKYISCASVGVLNGYAYTTEKLDRAEQMWKNLCNGDTRFLISQILRSSMLQQSIAGICEAETPITSTFYCSLLDLNHKNIVYKDLSTVKSDRLRLYLKASVAMPIYNRSVELDNTAYYDGAMVDNIPVYPLLKHKPDYIICVYFDDVCYKFENTCFDNKIIKIAISGESLLKQSVVFRQDQIDEMIKSGYDKARGIFEKVFFCGYKDLDCIYRAIEAYNRGNRASLRITGDVLVTNLNKITQKMIKRKVI